MRVDRQNTLEDKLEEILKSSQAAQKAAESANGYLFWMNVGYYVRLVVQIAMVVGFIVFGWYIVGEVRKLSKQIPQYISNINVPIGISVNLPTP